MEEALSGDSLPFRRLHVTRAPGVAVPHSVAEAGERAQEVARLEAERDGARQLAELAGRENERLRTELAQLRQTMAEHLQAMSRAFASPAGG